MLADPDMSRPLMIERQSVPFPAALLLFGLGMCYALLTPNPGLTALSFVVLAVIGVLLYRPRESIMLAFTGVWLWKAGSTEVFHANLLGLTLESFRPQGDIARASILTLLAVAAVVIGIAVGKSGANLALRSEDYRDIQRFSIVKLFLLALIGGGVMKALGLLARFSPGLIQPLIALSSVEMGAFYVLSVTILIQRRGYIYLAAALAVLVLKNSLGGFSSWKEPFYVFFVALSTGRRLVTPKSLILGVPLAGILVVFGAAWSLGKSTYRTQIGEMTTEQRLGSLWRMIEAVGEPEALADGLEMLAARLAYVEYFGLVLDRVPRAIEHTGGELWGAAITHVFVPRLFFPEKQSLVGDSVTTARFTGVAVSGADGVEATSIGIGYVAESYIDFGVPWMLLPCLVIGLAVGFGYKRLILGTRSRIIGYGLGVSSLLYTVLPGVETSCVKVVGGTTMTFLVLFLTERFVSEKLIKTLQKSSRFPY